MRNGGRWCGIITIMKFVDPRNDVAFKKIFGSEEKTEILIGFLNAVLDLEGDKAIQSVQLRNPYQTPRLQDLKQSILDINATDQRGVSFIVEMQVENVSSARKRFTYYVAKAYSSQIERGDDYPKLNQVIFVGILDFVLFENRESSGYRSRHQILDTETHAQELEDIEFNFIELPKFQKEKGQIEDILDKWIYFIKHAEDLEVVPEHVEEPELRAAYEMANQFGWNKADLEVYDYRGIKIQDERGALELAQERGRTEGQTEANRATARRLLEMGLGVPEITQATGLSEEEINSLS